MPTLHCKSAVNLDIPQPISRPETTFHCARCLSSAAILTTNSTKYAHAIKYCTKGKTATQFADAYLPADLRQPFHGIFDAITCALPGHSERNMCLLAPNPDKRQTFAQSAPSTNTNSQPCRSVSLKHATLMASV